ncbi:MAG: peroxiredoxin [Halobacteriales archaeon]|nr:peroxiredoxin [Halobacteriales archaeon]
MLEEGAQAPDFSLQGTHEGTIDTYRLSDYTDAGQWVLLTFYAFDFNPICTEGMCSLRDTEFFQFESDLGLFGISGDGIYSHQQFADQHDINFPLLSDTSKEVAEQYGVIKADYEGMKRVHQRALFLIDDSRTVRFTAAVDVNSPEEIDLKPVVEAIRRIRH